MTPDYKKMIDAIKEFPNTQEGKKYFEKQRKINEIKRGRYLKFEKYIETHDFDELMYRLILEHDTEWNEKCWHNGYEVHPNNKLAFVIDYVIHNNESIRVPQIESEHFPTETWMFKGYYFQLMIGQGSAIFIYNADDKKCLLSV